MSFLDNLENSLKNLESSEEGKEERGRQQRERETQLAQARAAAPFAEELKKGPFTVALLLPLLPLRGTLVTTPAANTPGMRPVLSIKLSTNVRRAAAE